MHYELNDNLLHKKRADALKGAFFAYLCIYHMFRVSVGDSVVFSLSLALHKQAAS